MDLQANVFRAAQTILHHCLMLPLQSQYLVIADETTLSVATILAEAGLALDLQPTILFYSSETQRQMQDHPLPTGFTNLLDENNAILICLSADQQTFAFRDHIRKTAWNADLKVAHMPGINEKILQMADLDYTALKQQCELFALALAKGTMLEILTQDQHGKTYQLNVPLDPWNRYPIISDGIIEAGVWGNVPSGETYIAPPEGKAYGEIVVSGSIYTYLVQPGEEIVLQFQDGALVDWRPKDNPTADYLATAIAGYAAEKGDVYWSNLAEVGLGANPKIEKLTGYPLIDEKKYGSVHIALGNNQDMGGDIHSEMHYDIVCPGAEVRVDGKTLIKNDQIVLAEEEWREDFRTITLPDHWSPNLRIRCAANEGTVDPQGRLKRFWHTSSGRVCYVPVGNERTNAQLASLYKFLQKNGHHSLGALAKQYRNLTPEDLMRATYLLSRYNLVLCQE